MEVFSGVWPQTTGGSWRLLSRLDHDYITSNSLDWDWAEMGGVVLHGVANAHGADVSDGSGLPL